MSNIYIYIIYIYIYMSKWDMPNLCSPWFPYISNFLNLEVNGGQKVPPSVTNHSNGPPLPCLRSAQAFLGHTNGCHQNCPHAARCWEILFIIPTDLQVIYNKMQNDDNDNNDNANNNRGRKRRRRRSRRRRKKKKKNIYIYNDGNDNNNNI